MSGTVVIAAREFRSFFLLPSGYVVGALFLLANGIVFLSGVFLPGQPATLRGVFSFDVIVLLFLCPAITMRAICEERRQGTWELLAASPSGAGAFILRQVHRLDGLPRRAARTDSGARGHARAVRPSRPRRAGGRLPSGCCWSVGSISPAAFSHRPSPHPRRSPIS